MAEQPKAPGRPEAQSKATSEETVQTRVGPRPADAGAVRAGSPPQGKHTGSAAEVAPSVEGAPVTEPETGEATDPLKRAQIHYDAQHMLDKPMPEGQPANEQPVNEEDLQATVTNGVLRVGNIWRTHLDGSHSEYRDGTLTMTGPGWEHTLKGETAKRAWAAINKG